MGQLTPGTPAPERPPEHRLDSWKEIAAYLGRDTTTVQRWEKREGMPVHRHLHDKGGSVYAVPRELEAWLENRRLRLQRDQPVPESEASGSPQPSRSREATSRRGLWLAVPGVAVLAVLATAYVMSRGRVHATQPKIRSLAVLPLKNMSGDPGQDYFADGMTEAVIGHLAGIHDLRVISRTSVMRFKNPQMSVPQIAKGTRRRRHRRRIRHARRQPHSCHRAVDSRLNRRTFLVRDLRSRIAATYSPFESDWRNLLLRKSKSRSPAKNTPGSLRHVTFLLRSMRAISKARLAKSNTRAEIEQSIASYQEQSIKTPHLRPLTWAGRAYEKLGGGFIGVPPEEVRPKVIGAVQKALELDPELADGHALLAGVYQKRWRWADAEAEYKRALELNPNDSTAYLGYASWLMCQGRMDEAFHGPGVRVSLTPWSDRH